MGKVDKTTMENYAAELKNWNKWGPDDELGTLNYVTPEAIVAAAALVKKGRVFSLAIPFDTNGPQFGERGRINPVRTMIMTGTDAVTGKQDELKIRYADDMVTMPTQCATHWDALGHIFYEYYDEQGQRKTVMWNGYPSTLVGSGGAEKCGIEKTKDKMVGRGILLDIARYKGCGALEDGYGITNDDLDGCVKAYNIEIRRGDFLLIRTGQLGKCLKEGKWGTYAGGNAPGLEFETLRWLHAKEIAAVASDTWGVEVRPNRTDEYMQPWHWIVLPIIGLTHGEMFNLEELAEDCAGDGRYEFLLVAPTIPFTKGVGSPVNPIAIK